MQVIGLCRFSYPGEGGFQVEHETIAARKAYLYAPARMQARLAQFEAVTLPGLKAQTDPDFTFVVVTGDSLPDQWREKLEDLLRDFPQAVIRAYPPGPHRKVMQAAINAERVDPDQPCLQFRHDDDDAVGVDFVERLRAAAAEHASIVEQNRLVAFDFDQGFSARADANGLTVADTPLSLYGVALGMAVRGGVQQSIMNFAHQKLGAFMPVVTYSDSPMFVRGHSDHNDSRQKSGITTPDFEPLSPDRARLFKTRFAINENTVRRVFSAL